MSGTGPAAGGTVSESIDVTVSPGSAYAAVSDVRLMSRWSPECRGVWIIGRDRTPRTGMRFVGRNRAWWLPWATWCTVVEAEPGQSFAFDVSFLGIALSRWRYRFTATPEGVRITEEWHDARSGVAAGILTAAVPVVTGVVRRKDRNRTTIRTTLRILKEDLEK